MKLPNWGRTEIQAGERRWESSAKDEVRPEEGGASVRRVGWNWIGKLVTGAVVKTEVWVHGVERRQRVAVTEGRVSGHLKGLWEVKVAGW